MTCAWTTSSTSRRRSPRSATASRWSAASSTTGTRTTRSSRAARLDLVVRVPVVEDAADHREAVADRGERRREVEEVVHAQVIVDEELVVHDLEADHVDPLHLDEHALE